MGIAAEYIFLATSNPHILLQISKWLTFAPESQRLRVGIPLKLSLRSVFRSGFICNLLRELRSL